MSVIMFVSLIRCWNLRLSNYWVQIYIWLEKLFDIWNWYLAYCSSRSNESALLICVGLTLTDIPARLTICWPSSWVDPCRIEKKKTRIFSSTTLWITWRHNKFCAKKVFQLQSAITTYRHDMIAKKAKHRWGNKLSCTWSKKCYNEIKTHNNEYGFGLACDLCMAKHCDARSNVYAKNKRKKEYGNMTSVRSFRVYRGDK